MKSRIGALMMVLTLACASLAAAQAKPNLNGTWKLNPQKSRFSPNGGSQSLMTIKFDQQDVNLTETLTYVGGGGERSLELKYTTDGNEGVNQIGPNSVKTTANWEGEGLVIEWKSGGGTLRRKLTLSGDGKTMTVAVHRGETGEPFETLVYEKQ